MGQFSASLKVPGDTSSLPATVDIDDGRLRVASGDHVIGNWALDDIDLSTGPEGVHVSAEGEELILQFSESEAFEAAAGLNGKKSVVSMPKPFKLPTLSKSPKHAPTNNSGTRPARSTPTNKVEKPAKAPSPASTSVDLPAAKESKPPKQPGAIDRGLERAEKLFGGRLPSWVFTRGGAFLVLAALVVAILLPSLVSTLLLISGLVLLVLGGVTMLDVVLAARLLKAKVTPTQTLIGGGILVLLGVLFGMLA
jgi:hypothetical protein